MNKKKSFFLLFMAIALTMGCSLPAALFGVTDSNAMRTEVAETVVAAMTSESTQSAVAAQPTESTLPTNTSEPTAQATETLAILPTPTQTNPVLPTLAPTQTNLPPTAIPCNAVHFVKDITIPDGTFVLTGSGFIKTWRLQNVGTCTWNSGYTVVFMNGNQMMGPNSFPLTSGTVAPNQMIDVSINLVAPLQTGYKQGNWALRSPDGAIFWLTTGPFWVKVNVVKLLNPSLHPVFPFIMKADVDDQLSGAVKSTGAIIDSINVGDDATNVSFQGFVAFDISTIPDGATIKDVQLDLTDFDTLGQPWGLGCLRLYKQNYGDLDATDYQAGPVLGASAKVCTKEDLKEVIDENEMITALQSQVGNNRVRFRVQFNEQATDGDGVADMIRFSDHVHLLITYIP